MEPVTKIVLFNGPPECGKDLASNLTHSLLVNEAGIPSISCRSFKFATHLKECVHKAMGINKPADYYEGLIKDEPRPEFYGNTPRQAYIQFSEYYIKPLCGKSFYGDRLVEQILRFRAEVSSRGMGYAFCTVSDSGFVEEAQPLIDQFGRQNILLVQIKRMGTNFNKKGDSRSYIRLWGVKDIEIINNGKTPENFRIELHQKIIPFLIRGTGYETPRRIA